MPAEKPAARYHTVTPYLTVSRVAALIDFLEHVFDAQVVERMVRPDGTLGHCEVQIGDSIVMMGEPPEPARIRPGNLYVYVPDVDATYARALANGAKSDKEPSDQAYGDRVGGFVDASGNTWWIATNTADARTGH